MYSQEEIVDHNNNTLCQQPEYDKMINAEATLQCGENIEQSMVIRRSMGPNGKTTGGYDDNYSLNSVLYDVEFPDGQVKEYSANLISENLLGRVGYEFTSNIMEAIVYHTQDANMAIPFKNKNVVAGSGKKTTEDPHQMENQSQMGEQGGAVDSFWYSQRITPG